MMPQNAATIVLEQSKRASLCGGKEDSDRRAESVLASVLFERKIAKESEWWSVTALKTRGVVRDTSLHAAEVALNV